MNCDILLRMSEVKLSHRLNWKNNSGKKNESLELR
jgi:hypothetical protein